MIALRRGRKATEEQHHAKNIQNDIKKRQKGAARNLQNDTEELQ